MNRLEQFGQRVARVGWRMGMSGVLVAPIICLAACEPQNSPVVSPAIVRPLDVTPPRVVLGPVAPITTEVAPKTDAGKEYVISAIRELPPSAIKDLLVSRIEPLLKTPTPKSIDIVGVTVPVYGFEVRMQTIPEAQVKGRVNPRNLKNVPYVEMTQNNRILLPYIDLAKSDEMRRFNNIAPNGTPLIVIDGKKGTKFNPGIQPEIVIEAHDTSQRNSADRDAIERIKKFTAVKEVSTLLLYLLQFEAMVQEMEKLGFNPLVEIKQADGTVALSEAMNPNMDILHNEFGRWTAVIDIAGSVIAYKAYANMPVLEDITRNDQKFARMSQAISRTNLGNTPQEIRKNAFHWVLTTPGADSLPHLGDINKIP